MPYKKKADKAKQMRRYRKRKAQERINFEQELRKLDQKLAHDLSRQFPGLFPSIHDKKKRGKK